MFSKQSLGQPYPKIPSPTRAKRVSSEHSDITMSDGDFSLPMEYSDTSDDLKEDGFTRTKLDREVTGSSTFRFRNNSFNKDSRVVRFEASNPSLQQSLSYDEDEDYEGGIFLEESGDQNGDEPPASSLGSNVWKVVSTVAHAVHRSPHPSARKQPPSHVSQESRDTLEYPHHVSLGERFGKGHDHAVENTPLLAPQNEESPPPEAFARKHPRRSGFGERDSDGMTRSNSDASEKLFQMKLKRDRAITVAASFLLDYEDGRPPSLPPDVRMVTKFHLGLHQVIYSVYWRTCLKLAGLALFLSSCFEGTNGSPRFAAVLNFFALVVLVFDLLVTGQFQNHQVSPRIRTGESQTAPLSNSEQQDILRVRQSRTKKWRTPLSLFLIALALETVCSASGLFADEERIASWSSVLKPIALFYISTKARDALDALNSIAPIVIRVIVVELFLILCFAAVACRLYQPFEAFQNLSTSFLSLFELSTTVVNPSLWMPMYEISRTAAVFFVLFVVTSVFYMHSLVLSVVFQSYIQAASEIHERSVSDREDDLRLAFMALQNVGINSLEDQENPSSSLVSVSSVRKALQHLRPHYNSMKINALIQILDPGDQQFIDFPAFRTKIRQALNASIRSTRTTTTFSLFVELVAALVAVANFFYVILLTSSFQADWFDVIDFPAGCALTLLGIFDLVSRFNPCKKCCYFTPMTRLSGTFDGLATVAALVSCRGMFEHLTGRSGEFLLMGRAIDLIRIMRFFKIFRDIVQRSAEVFPALLGPLVLVISTIHVFTYAGMALWGGEVEVGSAGAAIEPLYDLNNFNSYLSGVVTMFQVLVVNDWHAVASVFLHARRNSSPYIVFPFFIGGNLVMVSIMLNVLTAFFVGSFVTRLTQNPEEHIEGTTKVPKPRDFDITNSSRPVKRVSSEVQLVADGDTSTISSAPEVHEFDVFEREGYDKIMQTVAGNSDDDDFARRVCDFFEVFESLSPGREKVGYLTCCQKTMNRYGNRRFQTLAREFLDDSVLHVIVSDMHSELLALSSRRQDYRSLHRVFPHKEKSSKSLEISASLLRDQPAATLFVSRIVDKSL